MGNFKNLDLGLLFIRIGLGICLIMHGMAKILNGLGFIKVMLAKHALPEFIAYFVYIGEILAPTMLIVGFYSRVASVFVLCNSIAIIYLAHPNIFALTKYGGFEAEIVYLYTFMALCVLLSGSGKYAVKRD